MQPQPQDMSAFQVIFPDLPLARHQIYSTANPDVARMSMDQAVSPCGQLQHFSPEGDRTVRDFHCTHNCVGMQNVTMNALSYSAPVSLSLRHRDNFIFLVMVLRGECHMESGGETFTARAREMFVINMGQETRATTGPDFQELVLGIEVGAFSTVMSRLISRPLSVPVRFAWRPSLVTAPLALFIRLLCDEMDTQQNTSFGAITQLYEQSLVSLMLTSLPHNYTEWLQRGVPAAVPHYVHRAERFIRENLRTALTLEQIVSASGTGMRSLHRGFREFRRTTPMLFLKECRLQHARTQIRNQSLRYRSIAELAQGAGFDHPSKFTQAYKARFGELPSETRRCSVAAQATLPSALDRA